MFVFVACVTFLPTYLPDSSAQVIDTVRLYGRIVYINPWGQSKESIFCSEKIKGIICIYFVLISYPVKALLLNILN